MVHRLSFGSMPSIHSPDRASAVTTSSSVVQTPHECNTESVSTTHNQATNGITIKLVNDRFNNELIITTDRPIRFDKITVRSGGGISEDYINERESIHSMIKSGREESQIAAEKVQQKLDKILKSVKNIQLRQQQTSFFAKSTKTCSKKSTIMEHINALGDKLDEDFGGSDKNPYLYGVMINRLIGDSKNVAELVQQQNESLKLLERERDIAMVEKLTGDKHQQHQQLYILLRKVLSLRANTVNIRES